MFTGIIEEIGIVKEFSKSAKNASVCVECKKILEDMKLGDSIAINGVCQTVVKFDKNSFCAEISEETLNKTNFSSLKSGSQVNLERALTLNSRLGGHMVSGHVDGLAKILTVKKSASFYDIEFEINNEQKKYVVNKGSVTINGISLTVAQIHANVFKVAVIPHTYENTVLKNAKIGDFVNIELDIIAKYVEKFLSTGDNGAKSSINENFLKENGFF